VPVAATGVLRNRTNTGSSDYNSVQLEFRANNLFKQLTLQSAYTLSKNLDNVSEIFSTFGGGNTSAFSRTRQTLLKASAGSPDWTFRTNGQSC